MTASSPAARGPAHAPSHGWAALFLVVLASGASIGGVEFHRVWLLIVFSPVIEEIVFRAGLHESMLRAGVSKARANVCTALAFGIAHAAVRGDAAAMVVALPALLIGAAYGLQRRWWPCALLHAAMNGVWLVVLA